MLKFEHGQQSVNDTSDRIFQLVGAAPFHSPALRLADPWSKVIRLSRPSVALRSFVWAMTQAPPEVREMGRASVRALLLPKGMQAARASAGERKDRKTAVR